MATEPTTPEPDDSPVTEPVADPPETDAEAPAPEPEATKSEVDAEPEAEPATEPEGEPVAEPAAEPVAEPAATPVAKTADREPVDAPADAEPVAKKEPPVHLGIGVALALVVAFIVLAFSWPAVTADPRNVPLVITGSDQAQVAAIAAMLENNLDGAVSITTVKDAQAATRAIEQRDAYGAVVLGAEPTVLKATAASPAVAPMLDRIHEVLPQLIVASTMPGGTPPPDQVGVPNQGPPAQVDLPEVAIVDVVPLLDDDPRGMGLAAATLPLVLGGLVGGVAISLVVSGTLRRVMALVVYAITAGLAITALLQTWFGVLGGAYLANAAVFATCLLAIGATIVGCASLLGRPGIPIGPVVFLLLANPIAGVTMPPEFLPTPWGTVGQLFPPGAGATLVRSFSYFPDASTLGPWLVLATWIVFGFALAALAHLRESKAATAEPVTPGRPRW
ncbi:MAG: ABC transporter permease [Micrococcales bacterium]|nr:ABC transporter permease [Micrococcales bacterium]MCL2668275.1 ABC transporter permease [Micrococcales bacterium]